MSDLIENLVKSWNGPATVRLSDAHICHWEQSWEGVLSNEVESGELPVLSSPLADCYIIVCLYLRAMGRGCSHDLLKIAV